MSSSAHFGRPAIMKDIDRPDEPRRYFLFLLFCPCCRGVAKGYEYCGEQEGNLQTLREELLSLPKQGVQG
jgi:hypothetical protein